MGTYLDLYQLISILLVGVFVLSKIFLEGLELGS
jgi:hypothetical protein